jgi:tRNA nucleotidyltransferase (CCA-adding enzyme)
MTPKEAAARRDFTVNSMAMDIDDEVFDPFDGRKDLDARILRATTEAYKEDPLRVLRGMQFASRFNFTMDEKTQDYSIGMRAEFHTLSKERIWEEWLKWTKGPHPMAGLQILVDTMWSEEFPELHGLIGLPQDPEWHPEGDCWVHNGWVCQAAAEIAERENLSFEDRTVLMFAALGHDFGKVPTTAFVDGRWRAKAHADHSGRLAKKFLKSIMAPGWVIDNVIPLCTEHMAHVAFGPKNPPNDRVVRRLATRLGSSSLRLWSHVCEADASGRPPLPKGSPVGEWMEIAKKLAVEDSRPTPILLGRHLIEQGMKPGVEFGKIIKNAYEAQLDGEFDTLDGALEWLNIGESC